MQAKYISTKVIELGSCAFRQWRADHSHCHFIHGYQLKAKYWFGCKELDNKNWAVDFGGLKELKAKLQHVFDHTLCVAADDPCLDLFRELEKRDAVQLRVFDKGVGIERAAELCYQIAAATIAEKYGDRCWVERVEVFEHEDNSAVYSTPDVAGYVTIQETQTVSSLEPALEAVPMQTAPVQPQRQPIPAPVGNVVSSGKGGWFQGTTWG